MKFLLTTLLLGNLMWGKPQIPLLWITVRDGGSSGHDVRCKVVDWSGPTITVQCRGNQPIKPGMNFYIDSGLLSPTGLARPSLPIPAALRP